MTAPADADVPAAEIRVAEAVTEYILAHDLLILAAELGIATEHDRAREHTAAKALRGALAARKAYRWAQATRHAHLRSTP